MTVLDAPISDDPEIGHTVSLSITDLRVTYNGKPALEHITFKVPHGMRVAVVGPNGAGKSTLFKAIMGFLPIVDGTIAPATVSTNGRQHSIAYLPQHPDIDWTFPANVFDVTMMGRLGHIGWLRWPSHKDRMAVDRVLSLVSMHEQKNKRISELSGGQQQRVLIARALAEEASLLLLDEPFAGVDTTTTSEILEVLDSLRAEAITVLIAIHDLNLARSHFDRVLLLNRQVIAYGTPEECLTPQLVNRAYGSAIGHWHDGDQIIYLTTNDCCE